MRVVDAKDLDAVVYPVPHHPQHLVVEAGRVVVEVDRVDVLVLLRRVLRVGDRAVGQHGEPLADGPWPTGGRARTAARGPAPPPCRGPRAAATKSSKSSMVPSFGCTASWPPSSLPIAHGEPTSLGRGGHAVVAALAMHLADRVDRRQVHDVETHLRDARQRLGRRSRRCRARGCPWCPSHRWTGGTSRTTTPNRASGRSTHTPYCSPRVTSSRSGYCVSSSVDLGCQRRAGAGERVAGLAQRGRRLQQRIALLRGARPAAARSSSRAPISRSLDSSRLALAGVELGGDARAATWRSGRPSRPPGTSTDPTLSGTELSVEHVGRRGPATSAAAAA